MQPKVSVIMPAHNAEPTLRRACEGVLAQTVSALELIVVDDGSTDGTLDAARALAGADARLRVLARPHAGVSAARNAGLAAARAPYVAFVDADDAPRPRWLQGLLCCAGKRRLAVCGYRVEDAGGHALYSTQRTGAGCVQVTPEAYLEDLFSNARMYQGYVWNKLFSRFLIEAGGAAGALRFDEDVSVNEDRLFVFGYLLRADGVTHFDTPLYAYRAHGERPFTRAELSEFAAFEAMEAQLAARGLSAALDWARRDRFRSAADMLPRARRAGDEDAAGVLAGEVWRLRRYADSFPEYSRERRERFRASVSLAAALWHKGGADAAAPSACAPKR